MNLKICYSFQHVPNAIVFGLNTLVFGQTIFHSGRQRLIFMAQNTRSAQYYTLVLLFSATTNFFVMTLKQTKKNWTGKKHFGTCRRTRYYEETILLLRSYEIVFRSNAITWLLSLKAITNFRLHQNLFKYLFISFMTLCRG